MLVAQIKINTKVMAEIDALKAEREAMMAMNEKSSKANQVLTTRLANANEQLQYLKKKIDKRPSVGANGDKVNELSDANKENDDANANGSRDQT